MLRKDEGDPTSHWQHHQSSGEWKTNYVGDIWNRACDATVGCGQPGATWAVWKSSNIEWHDSESYVMVVRSVDKAGNVSNEQTLSFNFDLSTPTSKATTPGGAYTTRLTALAGTAEDQLSTGTVAGLDSSFFRVAVQRQSDKKWWKAATDAWEVPETSNTVLVGAGSGVKNWSLTLSSTFYDLLVETDTFKVFTWAKDRVNNPADSLNQESTTTVKLVFSYKSSTATLTSQVPEANSASNQSLSMSLVLNPEGSRMTRAWVAVIDTSPAVPFYWTGSSWSNIATTDPPPPAAASLPDAWAPGAVWLTTDSVKGTPDMGFVPGTTPDGLSAVTLDFDDTTTIKKPAWVNGSKYKIYVRARNTAGQHLDTSGWSNQTFIYDVSAPTLTAHYGIGSMSTDTVNPTMLPGLTIASGTITDNVSDMSDMRQVFLRIFDMDVNKYLNPTTLINFDVTSGDNAWASIELTGDEWSFDLASAKFVAGNKYKVELYAKDSRVAILHDGTKLPVSRAGYQRLQQLL